MYLFTKYRHFVYQMTRNKQEECTYFCQIRQQSTFRHPATTLMELCRVEICKGTVKRSSRLSQSPATQSASPDWPAEDKRERCTQRVEEWFRRNKKWQRESTESDWERERESVFDSTKTALRFHYSFSCYCWISECLFTLSAHERQRQTQKEKREDEMWELAA